MTREQAQALDRARREDVEGRRDPGERRRRLHGQHSLRRQPASRPRAASPTATVDVQSSFGPKHAVVTTNDFTDEALERAVEQSEALAKLAPDDPEAMPRARRRSSIETVNAYFDSTANLDAGRSRRGGADALEPCKAGGRPQGRGIPRSPESAPARSATTRDCSRISRATTRTTRSPFARRTEPDRAGLAPSIPTGRRSTSQGVSAARDREGAAVAESSRDRAGPLHGDPRAAGGRRSRAAARRSRSTRARPTKDAARSRSRAAATRSARRSSTSASRSSPIPAIRSCSRSRSTARDFPLGRQVCDRERRAEAAHYSRFWAQKKNKQPDAARRRRSS